MKLGIRGHLADVIMCVKFLVDRFRGYGLLTPPKLPFPIDLLRRPYNSAALPCDTVKRCYNSPERGVSVLIGYVLQLQPCIANRYQSTLYYIITYHQ